MQREWVDAYFEWGVDVTNRRVFIGEITEESVFAIIKGLYLMDTMSKEPCEMFISSYGGSMHEANALYDIMNTLKCPIHTFAFGKCMSAAPLLLSAGEVGQRWVAPHVAFMLHTWSASLDGKSTEINASVGHYNDVAKISDQLLAKHSNKPYTHWHRISNKNADYYFTAKEAIEWGIADKIWVEKEMKK